MWKHSICRNMLYIYIYIHVCLHPSYTTPYSIHSFWFQLCCYESVWGIVSLYLTWLQESSKVDHHPANIAMAAMMIGRLNMVIYSPSLRSFEVLFVLRRWSQLSLLPPNRFTHPRYPLYLEGTIYNCRFTPSVNWAHHNKLHICFWRNIGIPKFLLLPQNWLTRK